MYIWDNARAMCTTWRDPAHLTDSFPAAVANLRNMRCWIQILWHIRYFFVATVCLFLLILNLKFLKFATATGVTCCGGMCMFGSRQKSVDVQLQRENKTKQFIWFDISSSICSGNQVPILSMKVTEYIHWLHSMEDLPSFHSIWTERIVL